MVLTLNNFWGAETGGMEETYAFSGPSASSDQVHSGLYSYLCTGSSQTFDLDFVNPIPDAGSKCIVGFWYRTATDMSVNTRIVSLHSKSVDETVFDLFQKSTGVIALRNSVAERILGTTILSANSWYFIEAYVDRVSFPAEAEFWITPEGGTEVSQGTVVSGFTNSQSDSEILKFFGTNLSSDTFYDDIYIQTDVSGASDRLGACNVLPFRSNHNIVVPNWIKGATGTLNSGAWNNAQDVPTNESKAAIYNDTTARAGGVDTEDSPFAGPQDAENLLGIYYFDASDNGPTDPDSVWTDDANVFDGLLSTEATCSTAGAPTINELAAGGTTAPSSGSTINSVAVRIYGDTTGSINSQVSTNGLAEALGTATMNSTILAWGLWEKLNVPSGGWTWTKIQELEVQIYGSGDMAPRKIEIGVFETKTIDTIVAMKGWWRMLRTGGGGTVHYGLLGNTGTDIADSDRTVDFDPTTAYVNYFDVREDNLPLSTEYGRIGFEKDAAGQDFNTAEMLFQILHIPDTSEPTEITSDFDTLTLAEYNSKIYQINGGGFSISGGISFSGGLIIPR